MNPNDATPPASGHMRCRGCGGPPKTGGGFHHYFGCRGDATPPPWDGKHDPTGVDHLEESMRFADLGQRLYEALLVCVPATEDAADLRKRALDRWETRP